MEKNYNLPPIVWVRVTDFMHGWAQYELGGSARVGDQRVVSVGHLPGIREVFRMETEEDVSTRPWKPSNSMSASRRNMLETGLGLDAELMEREYGITGKEMRMFIPVECPEMCMTRMGVLRPWKPDVNMGRDQVNALTRLLRSAFWRAVEVFDMTYSGRMGGGRYTAAEMIEAFCEVTGTSGEHVEAIRREWQRRMKRNTAPIRAYPSL